MSTSPGRAYYAAYAAAFVFVATSAALSSAFTRQSARSPWFECIRPRWTPPPAVFGAVWSVLYVLLFVALGNEAARGARQTSALLVLLLLLNVLWCYAYFTARRIVQAAFVLVLIAALALYTLYVSCRTTASRLTTACIAPYAAWVCFATLLNAASIPRLEQCRGV